MDSLAQLTGNWWQLSPSVFVRAQAQGNTPAPKDGDFFRCPVCTSDRLVETENALVCDNCGRSWEIRDGIYDFRQPLNEPG